MIDRFKKLKPLYKILIFVAIVVVGVGGWIAYDNRPHPLGNEMVYLGKEDYGGGLFYTDYAPASVYYYETDMDEAEMKEYFSARSSDSDTLAFKQAYFTSPTGDFIFTYENSTTFKKKKNT